VSFRLFTPVRAAVRRAVGAGRGRLGVGTGRGQGLGLHSRPIRPVDDGHNIFLHHRPKQAGAPILCDFGVEVTRRLETAGEVYAAETPGAKLPFAVPRGPYNRMNEAHDAIGNGWRRTGGSPAAPRGRSMEIRRRIRRHGDGGRVPPEVAGC
jgi:hypothetical protein